MERLDQQVCPNSQHPPLKTWSPGVLQTYNQLKLKINANKKSPANAMGNAQQRCMFESAAKTRSKSVNRGRQTTNG